MAERRGLSSACCCFDASFAQQRHAKSLKCCLRMAVSCGNPASGGFSRLRDVTHLFTLEDRIADCIRIGSPCIDVDICFGSGLLDSIEQTSLSADVDREVIVIAIRPNELLLSLLSWNVDRWEASDRLTPSCDVVHVRNDWNIGTAVLNASQATRVEWPDCAAKERPTVYCEPEPRNRALASHVLADSSTGFNLNDAERLQR